MALIPKIVSTPLKWASKKILNRALLTFPGGNAHDPVACVFCPEMCRFSCPTAVVSGNDSVTPCNKMGLLYKEERWPGKMSNGGELWTLYDCTGCGRCTEFCVYGVPVADQLFAARAKFSWVTGEKQRVELSDDQDPAGDLAWELGDLPTAKRRKQAWLQGNRGVHPEPKAVFFLREGEKSPSVSWAYEPLLKHGLSPSLRKKLEGKSFLLHESVWLSRRLAQAKLVSDFVKQEVGVGVKLVTPFHFGNDCIDCGGEGVYARTFPDQARQMAQDIWERDRHRVDGILCMSLRCQDHLKKALPDVPIFFIGEGS